MDNYSLTYLSRRVPAEEKEQPRQQKQFADNRPKFIIQRKLKEGIQKDSIQDSQGTVIQGWWPYNWIIWLINYLRNQGSQASEGISDEQNERIDIGREVKSEVSTETEQQKLEEKKKIGEELREKLGGSVGDCLYQAVANITEGFFGAALELRYIAADWVLNHPNHHALEGLDVTLDDVVLTICTPGEWTGPAGDRAPVVLAYALNIRLEIVTNLGSYIMNEEGNGNYRIFYGGNHYTIEPILIPPLETSTTSLVESDGSGTTATTLSKANLSKRLSSDMIQQLRDIRRSLGFTTGFNSEDADVIRRIDTLLLRDVEDGREFRFITRYVENRDLHQLSDHSLKKEVLDKRELAKGDFFITGIALQGEAPVSQAPKGADTELIQDFENAINTGELTWNDFQGKSHNNVYHQRSGRTFKAHQFGKCIRLYIDSSEGKKSRLRAIYNLEGTTLRFNRYDSH